MKSALIPISNGQRVEIMNVAFPHLETHAQYIGKQGVIKRFIKCRQSYDVIVDNGKLRECAWQNVRAL